jgi:hypothetical protein
LICFRDEFAGVGDGGFFVCTLLKEIPEDMPVCESLGGDASGGDDSGVLELHRRDVEAREGAFLNYPSVNTHHWE